MKVRAYDDKDWSAWLRMSLALFANYAGEDLVPGMREFRARPYADGCDTSPVGYVEAWYVDPHVRREGYGRALLVAAEDWARGRGYREMGSDAQLGNDVSHAAHRRSGYEEVDRVVQYRKSISGS